MTQQNAAACILTTIVGIVYAVSVRTAIRKNHGIKGTSHHPTFYLFPHI